MAGQVGRKLEIIEGYSFFLDATNPNSYSQGNTTWTNLAGNGNNCNLIGGGIGYGLGATPSGPPSFSLTSQGGGALSFNGSSMFGSTSSDLGLGGDFTMITWIKKNSSTSQGYVVGAGWNSAVQAINFGVTGLTPTLNTGAGFPTRKEVAAGSITTDAWHHICAVRFSGYAYVYLNGIQVGSGDLTASYYTKDAAAVSYIGRSAYDSPDFYGDQGDYYYFGGMIGSVLIYKNLALSSDQIMDNYRQTKSRYGR